MTAVCLTPPLVWIKVEPVSALTDEPLQLITFSPDLTERFAGAKHEWAEAVAPCV
jgi:hypothetical protein